MGSLDSTKKGIYCPCLSLSQWQTHFLALADRWYYN